MQPSRRSALIAALLASTSAVALAQTVGTTSAVNRDALGTPPAADQRPLFLGTEVVYDERIETDANGLAQFLFLDQSAMTVGPNSSIVIDSFVYDPATNTGDMALSMTRGVLRFVGGALSKQPEGVTVRLPTATIGIRGGVAFVQEQPGGGWLVGKIFGEIVSVDGADCGAEDLIPNGYGAVIGPDCVVGDARPLTPAEIAGLQSLLAGAPGTTGGAPAGPTDEQVAAYALAELPASTDTPTSGLGSVYES